MAVSQFNLITATHSLESTGLSRAQAERITGTIQQAMEALISNLATKADLTASQATTQAALKAVQADIATHHAETQAAIKAVEADIATHRTETQAAIDTFRTETQAAIKGVQADIATHRTETQAAIKGVQADIATHRTETQAAIDTFRTEVQAAIKAVQADIATHRTETKDMATKSDLAALRAELFRALWLQSIGILTAIGVLLTISRMF